MSLKIKLSGRPTDVVGRVKRDERVHSSHPARVFRFDSARKYVSNRAPAGRANRLPRSRLSRRRCRHGWFAIPPIRSEISVSLVRVYTTSDVTAAEELAEFERDLDVIPFLKVARPAQSVRPRRRRPCPLDDDTQRGLAGATYPEVSRHAPIAAAGARPCDASVQRSVPE